MPGFASRPSRSTLSLILLLGVPTTLLFVLGGYVLYALLSESAGRLNETQRAGEERLARSIVRKFQGDLQNVVGDYSFWDEMYDFFEDPTDETWANDNLGPYVVDAFQADHTIAIGRDGEVIYHYHADAAGEAAETEDDHRRLNEVADRAFETQIPGTPTAIAGVVEFKGVPHFVAAAAVAVSAEERIAAGEKPNAVLFMLRPIDGALMQGMETDFGLGEPHVDKAGMPGVALIDPLGRPTGYTLHWVSRDVGGDFLASITPSVFTLIAGAVAAMLGIGTVWIGVFGRIQASEARAHAAEQTSQAKNLFLANMSHELRTPLNSIIGFSEILSSQSFGPLGHGNYAEYARDIHVSGRHLLGVVNDLLLMSKLDAGQHQIEIEAVALDEIVRESERMVSADAQARGIEIAVAPPAEPLDVLGGHQALRQILINLLGNAIKFSPEGGRIEIAWRRAGPGRCALTVADRGCGMPADVLARLGRPFNQSDSSFTRHHQGSGLGLAICFGLARAMNGDIAVSSAPGAGTAITLEMPLAPPSKTAQARGAALTLDRRPAAA
ncbi:MAG: hypothetical protein JNL56_05230 [Alphaproteobacteria bacterium]|nr:hypothetical protein [Alphaproteobacteria bacterium]